jgi:hypothetical protein
VDFDRRAEADWGLRDTAEIAPGEQPMFDPNASVEGIKKSKKRHYSHNNILLKLINNHTLRNNFSLSINHLE